MVKQDVGKLCLPYEVVLEEARLRCATRREMAYHVGGSRTDDKADAWLLEAMTPLVDADVPSETGSGLFLTREIDMILEGASR